MFSCSAVSDSFQPYRVQPARLLCPWDFPGKNTGVGHHFLLQGIFPTQGLNLGLLHCRPILYRLSYKGSKPLCDGYQGAKCQAKTTVLSSPASLFLYGFHPILLLLLLLLLQSCPTLCDPIDGSPPGSPVPGILQARTLGWVAISFSNA